MKQIMLGNAAIARGMYEAGVRVVSSYPGTPSTEITEEAAKFPEIYCEWAPNEKVALEVAHGASLGGVRAACTMKHVGLNVAADPLFTISYQGVSGGLLVCVADDPGMHSSQNEQDSRHYAIAAKIPMLEPSNSAESLEFTKRAYELSERYHTPVMLRTVTRVAHSQSVVDTGERVVPEQIPYVKDQDRVMMTVASRKAHVRVEERTRQFVELGETSDLNRIEWAEGKSQGSKGSLGIITSGIGYQYVKEVYGDSVSILKIGLVNPLPEKLIRDFAAACDRVIVVEELDPILENHCKALGLDVDGKNLLPICGEFSQGLLREKLGLEPKEFVELGEEAPARPPVMCAGCPHRGVFFLLKKLHCMVYGDIGCYTLGAIEPLNSMDLNVCMGASVSGLHGFNLAMGEAGEKKSVGVIGDSTFCHSGVTGLMDIAYNGTNSTVIVLDNSTTGMTGHQQNPTTGKNLRGEPATKIDLEALCRAVGIERVVVADPYDLKAFEAVLREELAAEAPSVIISRRPCAMLKGIKHNPPVWCNKENCKKCTSCMRIGCPALSRAEDGTTAIDTTLCVGCGVCTQMCRFDALKEAN